MKYLGKFFRREPMPEYVGTTNKYPPSDSSRLTGLPRSSYEIAAEFGIPSKEIFLVGRMDDKVNVFRYRGEKPFHELMAKMIAGKIEREYADPVRSLRRIVYGLIKRK